MPATEREQLSLARVGQSRFRRALLEARQTCQICQLDVPELLSASHIKPWVDATDPERLDPENGLLLCAIHERAFDLGYLIVAADQHWLVSPRMTQRARDLLNVSVDVPMAASHRQ